MIAERRARVLLVTDHAAPTDELLGAIRARAGAGAAQFRVVVLNPARAELHPLHPEHHDKATAAEEVLVNALVELEEAAGGPVLGSVSVRHDAMDAIEETIFNEPVDEIILSLPAHPLAERIHQDLPSRLKHFGIPVTRLD